MFYTKNNRNTPQIKNTKTKTNTKQKTNKTKTKKKKNIQIRYNKQTSQNPITSDIFIFPGINNRIVQVLLPYVKIRNNTAKYIFWNKRLLKF